MGDVQLHFHVHQTTLTPVLLCVLVHYHPDTRHHLQGTMPEPLGAHGSPGIALLMQRSILLMKCEISDGWPPRHAYIGEKRYIGQCFSFIVQPLHINVIHELKFLVGLIYYVYIASLNKYGEPILNTKAYLLEVQNYD